LKQFFNDASYYSKTTDHPEKNLRLDAMRCIFNGSANLYVHADYVKDIREAESTLGDFVFRTGPTSQVFRSKRSIYPKCDIENGQEFSEKNIGIFRPGLSLQPEEFERILGQKATRNLRKGERMLDSDIGI
jgi:sialic acid synthase SpsE